MSESKSAPSRSKRSWVYKNTSRQGRRRTSCFTTWCFVSRAQTLSTRPRCSATPHKFPLRRFIKPTIRSAVCWQPVGIVCDDRPTDRLAAAAHPITLLQTLNSTDRRCVHKANQPTPRTAHRLLDRYHSISVITATRNPRSFSLLSVSAAARGAATSKH